MDWFDEGYGRRISPTWMVCFVLIGIAVLMEIRRASSVERKLKDFLEDPELELIQKIHSTESSSEREALIVQLERTPYRFRRFHARWMSIHKVRLQGVDTDGIRSFRFPRAARRSVAVGDFVWRGRHQQRGFPPVLYQFDRGVRSGDD